MHALSEVLNQATSLQELDLSSNVISDRGGACVAGLLLPCSSCQLSKLDLSLNYSLATTTADKIAQALQYNSTLVTLNVARSKIGVARLL
jgi:Ran GTPase-activating protein (RanGAP) involved in mRNA processing and transport